MAGPPRLLDRLREKIRLKHYSMRTEEPYARWVKHLIRFHEKRHPAAMGAPEVEAFLTRLAVAGKVAALSMLLGNADVGTTMTYTHVLNRGGRGVMSPLDRMS